jgi:hypothetical protein
MRLQKHQKGLSIWSFSFNLFLLGFAVFVTLKLLPIYMEDFSVGSAVSSLESDPEEFRGALTVRNSLFKRFDMNNISRIEKENISIIRQDQEYLISVNYEVEVPFVGNITLILRFEHSAVVKASV